MSVVFLPGAEGFPAAQRVREQGAAGMPAAFSADLQCPQTQTRHDPDVPTHDVKSQEATRTYRGADGAASGCEIFPPTFFGGTRMPRRTAWPNPSHHRAGVQHQPARTKKSQDPSMTPTNAPAILRRTETIPMPCLSSGFIPHDCRVPLSRRRRERFHAALSDRSGGRRVRPAPGNGRSDRDFSPVAPHP